MHPKSAESLAGEAPKPKAQGDDIFAEPKVLGMAV